MNAFFSILLFLAEHEIGILSVLAFVVGFALVPVAVWGLFAYPYGDASLRWPLISLGIGTLLGGLAVIGALVFFAEAWGGD